MSTYDDSGDYGLSPYERAVKRGGQKAGDDLLKASDEYYSNYAQGPGDPNPGLPKAGGDATRPVLNWNEPSSFSWLTNTPGPSKDSRPDVTSGQSNGPSNGNAPDNVREQAIQDIGRNYSEYQAPQRDTSDLDNYVKQLMSGLEADRARQAQERAAMRELLMGQIGQASKPVTMKDPGIAEILSAQRGAGQRSQERSRLELTEGLSADGQLFRGAFNPRNDRIEQQRAEQEQQFIGDIMNRELSGRRNQLQSLLAMAVSMGDAESARSLQAQLSLIDGQLRQGQFNAQLGQNRYMFDSDFDLRRAFLESGNNANATNVILR